MDKKERVEELKKLNKGELIKLILEIEEEYEEHLLDEKNEIYG